jgi:hypothetical protein
MRSAVLLLLLCKFSGLADESLNPVEIVRRACDRETANQNLRRQYTFRESLWQRVNKKEQRRVDEVFYIAGQEYRRVVEKDGNPLPPEKAADEQRKLDKELNKARHERPEQARKRADKEHREAEEFRDQVAQAFDFKLVSEEVVSGRACYRIHGDPKPGFQAKGDAKVLAKMKGDIWIDKSDFHWAKVDLETTDTITGMGGIVRLARGTKIAAIRTFINNEVWMPQRVEVQAAAKALLFISAAVAVDLRFSDFKKFSVDSKVTFSGE